MYLAPEKGDNLWRKMKSNWRFNNGELGNKYFLRLFGNMNNESKNIFFFGNISSYEHKIVFDCFLINL